jgi:uncharacterized protein YaiE (UPF0345 family)
MWLDERTEFADATSANTGAAGTYLVGDVVDTGIAGSSTVSNDLGLGESAWLVIQVDTAFTSGGSATVAFHLASDAGASIATDGSATYHFSTSAIPVATLVAGYTVAAVRLPSGTYERYLGILQTTGTAALTAGKFNAFVTNDFSRVRLYADASN